MKRRLLTSLQAGTLRSGERRIDGLCTLPNPLHGAARLALVQSLYNADLVRITQWLRGDEVGTITERGREVLATGYIPAETSDA